MNQASLEAVKMGLMQYVGALLQTSNREGKDAVHVTLATLSEVWLECCKDKEGKSYDMFIGKPILRASSFLLKEYINKLIKDAGDNESVLSCIEPKLKEYNNAIKVLDELVDQIKEGVTENESTDHQ